MTFERWKRVLANETLPCAAVDLDAMEANQDLLVSRMARDDVTLRVASKSVRIPAVLRRLLDRSGRFAGLMTYSASETALLA